MPKQPPPADADELRDLFRKGNMYLDMIDADANGALDIMKQRMPQKFRDLTTSQSPYTDPKLLERDGWLPGHSNAMWHIRGVNEMLRDLRIPHELNDKRDNQVDVKIAHTVCFNPFLQPFTVNTPIIELHG